MSTSVARSLSRQSRALVGMSKKLAQQSTSLAAQLAKVTEALNAAASSLTGVPAAPAPAKGKKDRTKEIAPPAKAKVKVKVRNAAPEAKAPPVAKRSLVKPSKVSHAEKAKVLSGTAHTAAPSSKKSGSLSKKIGKSAPVALKNHRSGLPVAAK